MWDEPLVPTTWFLCRKTVDTSLVQSIKCRNHVVDILLGTARHKVFWSLHLNSCGLLQWCPSERMFIKLKPNCLKMALPIVSPALSYQSAIRRRLHRPVCWPWFLIWVPFCPNNPVVSSWQWTLTMTYDNS